jgi:gliding motility-associated-like protein
MIEPLRGFSPDNDGFNDKWLIRNIDHYPSNKVSIFTPEGEEVCVIKGYDNKTRYWDGSVSSTIRKAKKNTYSGKYSYIIDLGNGSDTIKGFVVINQ